MAMVRLCEDGRANFVILDADPIYSSADIDRICKRHGVEEQHRSDLWRRLESSGRAFLDQRRLQSQPAKLARIRQDLRLGRQLAAQLAELAPEAGQISADKASVLLSRCHLSALREGERRTGAGAAPGARLDEIRATLFWLAEVYETALESCTRGGEDAGEVWRASLTEFYTRVLIRPWTGAGEAGGERFLADCLAVLERGEAVDAPPITALNLAARA
jgi:multidrug efflux pump subunit AcrA (membrane-fusion protein)